MESVIQVSEKPHSNENDLISPTQIATPNPTNVNSLIPNEINVPIIPSHQPRLPKVSSLC